MFIFMFFFVSYILHALQNYYLCMINILHELRRSFLAYSTDNFLINIINESCCRNRFKVQSLILIELLINNNQFEEVTD